MHFTGTRPCGWRRWRAAPLAARCISAHVWGSAKTAGRSFTQFLHSCGKRFMPFRTIYSHKWRIFNVQRLAGNLLFYAADEVAQQLGRWEGNFGQRFFTPPFCISSRSSPQRTRRTARNLKRSVRLALKSAHPQGSKGLESPFKPAAPSPSDPIRSAAGCWQYRPPAVE